jgi:hypothetical protein
MTTKLVTMIAIAIITLTQFNPNAVEAKKPIYIAAKEPPAVEAGKQYFKRGADLYGKEKYQEAIEQFREAFVRTHKFEILFNIALCYERLGLDKEAIAVYEDYITRVDSKELKDEAFGKIQIIRDRLRERDGLVARQPPIPSPAPPPPPTPPPPKKAEPHPAVKLAVDPPKPVAPPPPKLKLTPEWRDVIITSAIGAGMLIVGGGLYGHGNSVRQELDSTCRHLPGEPCADPRVSGAKAEFYSGQALMIGSGLVFAVDAALFYRAIRSSNNHTEAKR